MPQLSPTGLFVALCAAACIGLSKSGFSGISLIPIVIFAELYGAKTSVGLLLPLLIAADFLAYPAFRKHGSWHLVWKLIAPTLVGLWVGWLVLGEIDDDQMRRFIGGLILFMAVAQLSRRIDPAGYDKLAQSRGCGTAAGLFGGFSTMLANAAGPIIQLYLLARRIPKMDLIGTGARFFLLVNLVKVPFNARLAMITPVTLGENLKLLPAVALGVFGGRWLVRKIPQKAFENMILAFSIFGGLKLLVS